MAWHSQTWNWINGAWVDGNPGIMGPRSHGSWLGSTVFDGARVFEGLMPDIERHAARVNRSAATLGLTPTMTPEAIIELAREGVKKFAPGTAIYVKPMYWGEADGPTSILPNPDSVGFCLCLFEAPMPTPTVGTAVTLAKYRRPSIETAPTDSKSGCLYPNNARVLRAAREAGFDNALVLDMLGNVAETATANIFMVKDGVVKTPVPNGTFLNGITRQRVIMLLRQAGYTVEETALRYDDFVHADEIFSSGNYSKVMPVTRIDQRVLQPGPMARKTRELYMDFALSAAA